MKERALRLSEVIEYIFQKGKAKDMKELAQKVGVTRQALYSARRGAKGYSSGKICKKVADIAELDSFWLLHGGEKPSELRECEMPNEIDDNIIDQAGALERIEKTISMLKMSGKISSKTDFASEIGYEKSSVYRVLDGSTQITDKFLRKISKTYDVSIAWLKRGVGSMMMDEVKGKIPNNEKIVEPPLSLMRVPIVPIAARAGYLLRYEDVSYLDMLPDMEIPVDRYMSGVYRVFEVAGDSMDDETKESLLHGDRVLCRSIDFKHWETIPISLVRYWVVVTREEGIVIKKISGFNAETQTLTLSSNNKEYENIEIELQSILELYSVEGIVQRKMMWYK